MALQSLINSAQRNGSATSGSIKLDNPISLTVQFSGTWASDATATITILIEREVTPGVWQPVSSGVCEGGPPPFDDRTGLTRGPTTITANLDAGTYRATLTPNKSLRFGLDRVV